MTQRLVVSYLSLTLLVLVILEVPLGALFAASQRASLVNELQHDALALSVGAEETLEGGAKSDLAGLVREYQRRSEGRVVIVNKRGDVVVDSAARSAIPANFAARPEIATALAGRSVSGTRHSKKLGIELFYVAVPTAPNGTVYGAVRITLTSSKLRANIRHMWTILALVGMIVLFNVAGVSILLARSMTRPLRLVERGARTLGAGDLGARVSVPSGPSEARVLADEFNAMATRIEHLVASQRTFVADASHQLRTPLAALRLRLENVESIGGASAEDVAASLTEVERLSRLVDGLLQLARVEAASPAPISVDASAIATERIKTWTPAAEHRNVTIDLVGQGTVSATPGHLEQILDNLLSNALCVAPSGSRISVEIEAEGTFRAIHIRDAGPGMTADERANAFDRFWSARGGSGLGLTIVGELVTHDGGDVRLDDALGGGLDVSVRLPRG